MSETNYQEVQYMRHVRWVMVIVVSVAVLMWWGFIQQIVLGQPWGSNPGPDWVIWLTWLLFGIGFPLAFYMMRLIVSVKIDHIAIRYIPLTSRDIPLTEIANVQVRTYNPIMEYGGWGIRGFSNRRAYNVSGNKGVELTLYDGRIVMIGSQKPEQLALAILSRLKP